MRLIVIVNELGHGIVVAARNHARRRRLGFDCRQKRQQSVHVQLNWERWRAKPTLLLVLALVRRVGRVRAYHLLHLVADAHALDHLHVLEPRQDLVLHLEARLHAKRRAFFDGKGLAFERVERAFAREVDDYVGPALDLGSVSAVFTVGWHGAVEGRVRRRASG